MREVENNLVPPTIGQNNGGKQGIPQTLTVPYLYILFKFSPFLD